MIFYQCHSFRSILIMKIELLAKKISNKQLYELITRALNGTLRTAKGLSFSKKQLDGSTTKGKNIRNFLANPDKPYPAKTPKSREKQIAYILSVITQKMDLVDLYREIELMDATNEDKASVEMATENTTKSHKEPSLDAPTVSTASAPTTHNSDAPTVSNESAPITHKPDDHLQESKDAMETLQADKERLTKENQDLHQQINTLKEQHAKDQALFGSILASRESELQAEITLLKSQLAAKQSDSMSIFGMHIGVTLQKFPRANNQVKEIQVWYAYDNSDKEHRKKIYLGSVFDMEKFKQVLIEKGYSEKTPLPTTPIPS